MSIEIKPTPAFPKKSPSPWTSDASKPPQPTSSTTSRTPFRRDPSNVANRGAGGTDPNGPTTNRIDNGDNSYGSSGKHDPPPAARG